MKTFNGKPMSYWEREAKKLVVSLLLQAADLDTRMLPCEIASKRLKELALAESPTLVKEILSERNRIIAGQARALQCFMLTPAEIRKKKERITHGKNKKISGST